jgi:hypothetical protein
MANLFPTELDLGAIAGQVEQLAQLLSEVAAERYAIRSLHFIFSRFNSDMQSHFVLCLRTFDARSV